MFGPSDAWSLTAWQLLALQASQVTAKAIALKLVHKGRNICASSQGSCPKASAPQAPAWGVEGAQTCLWSSLGLNLDQEQPWVEVNRLRVELVLVKNREQLLSALYLSEQREFWRTGRDWLGRRGGCQGLGEEAGQMVIFRGANRNAHSRTPRPFHLNGCVNGSHGAGRRGLNADASVYCTGCK